jgi:hypothetical protein
LNIKQIIKDSLVVASAMPDEGTDEGIIHRNRSKHFVESLAAALREFYRAEKGLFVLSKHHGDHRLEFGLNELLYDILVCKTAQVSSSLENEVLTFVTKAIWLVESEFARNSREAIYDFNKLVLGSSENKLFVGPQVSDEPSFLQPLCEPAKYCDSKTYIALVPHPSDWRRRALDVHCWIFENGWQSL